MGKSTRRKYYKRRGIWSTNISELNSSNQLDLTGDDGDFFFYKSIVENPPQSANSVSQKYTVKNVEATFEIDVFGSSNPGVRIENLTAYILYIPQNMQVNNQLLRCHPEYVMAYRYIGSPMSDNNIYRNPLRIKTRLARKLNTGDRIIIYVKGFCDGMTGGTPETLSINGLVRWWTKAN